MNTHNQLFQTFKTLISHNLSAKNLTLTHAEQSRMNKELAYIEQGGLAEYFIYIYQLVEICKKLKIVREPESGAIACWYVNYLLGIIYRNPLEDEYDLEQFYIPSKDEFTPFQITIPLGYAEVLINELEKEIELLSETCIYYTTYKKMREYEIVKKNQQHFSTWSFLIAEDISLNRLQEIVRKLPEQLHPQNLPLNDSKIIQQTEYKHQMDSFRVLKQNDSKNVNCKFYDYLLPELLNGADNYITSQDQVIKIAVAVAGLSIEDAAVLNSNCWKYELFKCVDLDIEQKKKFYNKIRAGAIKNNFLSKKDINQLINEIDYTFVNPELSVHSSQKRSAIIFDYWLTYYRYYFEEINQLYEDKVIENKHYISDDEKTIDISFLDFAERFSYAYVNNVSELRDFLQNLNYKYNKKNLS